MESKRLPFSLRVRLFLAEIGSAASLLIFQGQVPNSEGISDARPSWNSPKRIAQVNEVSFSEPSNLIFCPLLQLAKLLGGTSF